jgi:hypothetical protein
VHEGVSIGLTSGYAYTDKNIATLIDDHWSDFSQVSSSTGGSQRLDITMFMVSSPEALDEFYTTTFNLGDGSYEQVLERYTFKSFEETVGMTDYVYEWDPSVNTISDTRDSFTFSLTTQNEDIPDFKPITDNFTKKVETFGTEIRTNWEIVKNPDIEQKIVITERKEVEGQGRSVAEFGVKSITAENITLTIGENSTIQGAIAARGTFAFEGDGSLSVDGVQATDDQNNAIDIVSSIEANGAMVVNGAKSITLHDKSKLVSTTGDVTLSSDGAVVVDGEVSANSAIDLDAGGDVTLKSKLQATDSVSVEVVNGSQNGSITSNGEFVVDTTTITLTAGAQGGDVTLTDSIVKASDTLTLQAQSGKVSNPVSTVNIDGTDFEKYATLQANSVVINAANAITATLDTTTLSAQLSDAGDITLKTLDSVTLEAIEANDGAINIEALGDIAVTSVKTLGSNDRNNITLKANKLESNGDISIATLQAGAKGDITLIAPGAITQTGGAIKAEKLTLDIPDGFALTTDVEYITFTTQSSADIVIDQVSDKAITFEDVNVANGTLDISADGDVVLTSVSMLTDEKSVSVDAVGNIEVGSVVANNADISLKSGKAIVQSVVDSSADLTAKSVTLEAQEGIEKLELQVDELTKASTTTGSITLVDMDAHDVPVGLVLGDIDAQDMITITATNNILSTTDTSLNAKTIILESKEANIDIVEGSEFIQSEGVSLVASQGYFSIFDFFTGTQLTKYVSSQDFQFGATIDALGDITSDSVILQSGGTIDIDGKITASDLVRLDAGNNVSVQGILGNVANVEITARGLNDVTFLGETIEGGNISITAEESGSAEAFEAQNFTLRAKSDITIDVASDVVISGFMGGISGFDSAKNIALRSQSGDVTISGSIISAEENIVLEAQAIDSDSSSVFIASDINAKARGDIFLNTLTDTITLHSTQGDLTVNEADDVTITKMIAVDGAINMVSGGDITAYLVKTTLDNDGNDIFLKALNNLYIDEVSATVQGGAEREFGVVTLEANQGEIAEVKDYAKWKKMAAADSAIFRTTTPTNDQIDTFEDGLRDIAAKTINMTDTDTDLEYDATVTQSVLTTDNANSDIYIGTTALTGTTTIEGSATFTVVKLPIDTLEFDSSETLTIKSGIDTDHDLTIVTGIDVGAGSVVLNSGGGIGLGGEVKADDLTITLSDDITLESAVNTLDLRVSETGNVNVNQTGDLDVTHLETHGGDVSFYVDGNVTFHDISGDANSFSVTVTDGHSIVINGGDDYGAGSTVLSAVGGSVMVTLDMQTLELTADNIVHLSDSSGFTLNSFTATDTTNHMTIITNGQTVINSAITKTGNAVVRLETGELQLNASIEANNDVTITTTGDVSVAEYSNIITNDHTLTLQSGGALTLSETSVINTGDGGISLSAIGDINVGKVVSTTSGTVSIVSSGGAIVDSGEGALDIDVANAALTLEAVNGIGAADSLEIKANSLAILNGNGEVNLVDHSNTNIVSFAHSGAGGTIESKNSDMQLGDISSGDTGTLTFITNNITLNGAIETRGSGVHIVANVGDIVLRDQINVDGSGDITLEALNGSIVNDIASVRWLSADNDHVLGEGELFNSAIFDAITSGAFSASVETGEVLHEDGRVLHQAKNLYLQTTDGDMTLKALGTIGGRTAEAEAALQAGETDEETKARHKNENFALSLFVDASNITISSVSRDAINVLATDSISVSNANGEQEGETKAGIVNVYTLTGEQAIETDLDAGDEDIAVVANDIRISGGVKTTGDLQLGSLNPDTKFRFGSTQGNDKEGEYTLDLGENDLLDNTIETISIGGEGAKGDVVFGDDIAEDGSKQEAPIVVKSNVIVQTEGKTFVNSALQATSIRIFGPHYTVTLNDDMTSENEIEIHDSLKVGGENSLTAGSYIHATSNAVEVIQGDGIAGDDTLTINANDGDVHIVGNVGATAGTLFDGEVVDNLEGFYILDSSDQSAGAINVTLDQDLYVEGDVTIHATGDVYFGGDVNVTGTLTVIGADTITFASNVMITQDMSLEANEIDFDGTSVDVNGAITFKATEDSRSILFGQEVVKSNALNIDETELAKISANFTDLTLGKSGGADVTLATDRDFDHSSLSLYGKNIELQASSDSFMLGGDVTIEASKNIAIDSAIETTGAFDLETTSGKIKVDSDALFKGTALDAQAKNGIDIDKLDVSQISAVNSGRGAIDLHVVGDATTLNVTQLQQLSADYNGDIDLRADNSSIVLDGASTVGSGDITIIADTQNLTLNSAVSTTIGSIEMNVGGTMRVESGANISASLQGEVAIETGADLIQNANITSGGALVSLVVGNDLTMDGQSSITTYNDQDDAAVTIQTGGDMNIGVVGADGVITLTAGGAIGDSSADDSVANLQGGITEVIITAQNGVGSAELGDIDTDIATLTVVNEASGGMFIDESDDLTINTLLSKGTDGTIRVASQGGALTIDEIIKNSSDVGHIVFEASDAITINQNIESSHGNIALSAGTTLTLADGLNLISKGSSYDIEVVANSVVLGEGTKLETASNGDVVVRALDGDITFDTIVSYGVVLDATGNLYDSNTNDNDAFDIEATQLIMKSGGTIDALDTNVNALSASLQSGTLEIDNEAALLIGTASVALNHVDRDDNVSIVTHTLDGISAGESTINIDAVAFDIQKDLVALGAGEINLTAEDGNININALVDSGSGNMHLITPDIVRLGELKTTMDITVEAATFEGSGSDQHLDISARNVDMTLSGDNTTFGTLQTTIRTDIDKLTLDMQKGSIYIDEVDDIILDSSNTIQTTNLSIVAGGDIEIVKVVEASKDVSLESGGDITFNAIDAEGSTVSITSTSGAVTAGDQERDIIATALEVNISGDLASSGDLLKTTVHTFDLQAGGIYLENSTDMKASQILANGNVVIEADTLIFDENAGLDLQGDAVEMTLRDATSGFGELTHAVMTDVTSLDLTVGNGAVVLEETDGIALDITNNTNVETFSLKANGDVTLDGEVDVVGDVLLQTTGNVVMNDAIATTEGDVTYTADQFTINVANTQGLLGRSDNFATTTINTLTATTLDAIYLDQTGSIVFDANMSVANDVKVNVTDGSSNVTFDGTVTLANGEMVLNVGKAVALNGAVTLQTADKDVTITSSTNSIAIDTLTTNNGTVTLTAQAGAVSANDIVGAEAIVDQNSQLTNDLIGNIDAQKLNLTANSGIDITLDQDRTLTLDANNGDISVVSSANVTIATDGDEGVVVRNDKNITLQANSLTFEAMEGSNVHAFGSGDVTLTSTGGDITTTSTVAAETGKVTITSANDLIQQGDIRADDTITMTTANNLTMDATAVTSSSSDITVNANGVTLGSLKTYADVTITANDIQEALPSHEYPKIIASNLTVHSQNDQAHTDYEVAAAKVNEANVAIDGADEVIDEANTAIDTANSKIATEDQIISDADATIAQAQTTIDDATTKIATAQTELNTANAQLDAATTDEEKAQINETIATLTQTIATLNEEKTAAQEEKTTAQTAKSEAQTRKDSAVSDRTTAQTTKDAAQTTKDAAQAIKDEFLPKQEAAAAAMVKMGKEDNPIEIKIKSFTQSLANDTFYYEVIDVPFAVITNNATEYEGDVIRYSFIFEDVVTGFTVEDIVITNGEIVSALQTQDGKTYTIDIAPLADFDGQMQVTLPENSVLDQDLFNNVASIDHYQNSDTIAPTVNVVVDDSFEDFYLLTLTFSEGMYGFDPKDIDVTHGSVSSAFKLGDEGDTVYQIAVTPEKSFEGNMRIDLFSKQFGDKADNRVVNFDPILITVDTLNYFEEYGSLIDLSEKIDELKERTIEPEATLLKKHDQHEKREVVEHKITFETKALQVIDVGFEQMVMKPKVLSGFALMSLDPMNLVGENDEEPLFDMWIENIAL